MKFQKGKSGNPSGRPKGTKSQKTQLLEAMLQDEAEEVIRQVIASAKGGDISAARLVLERLIPPVKDKPVSLDMKEIKAASDIPVAMNAIIESVAAGDMTPSEGQSMMNLLEAQRKAFETAEFEQRLIEVESRLCD